MHMDGIWLIEFILKRVELLSSKSSVQSTAAGHVGQNSSAQVARSVAAIWTLLLLKWSKLSKESLLLFISRGQEVLDTFLIDKIRVRGVFSCTNKEG